MSNSYEFVNYTDIASMHDPYTGLLIRKHAMKHIGVTRRHRRERYKIEIELPCLQVAPGLNERAVCMPHEQDEQAQLSIPLICRRQILDDRALYDAFIRSLSCKTDPFNAAAVSIDATARRLLQYFTYCASRYPNPWTYTSSPLLPNRSGDHSRSISATIASALRDSLLANCLLATAASRLYYVEGNTQPRLEERELALTQEALRLAQSRLARNLTNSVDEIETLITCALHLGSAAFYKGDITAARLHIQAATSLANRIGGLNAVRDPYVRGRIISFDDLTSCIELRPCFMESIYDLNLASSAPPSRQLAAYIAVDGRAHELLLKECSLFSSALQELTLQIIQCHQISTAISESRCTTSFESLACWQWLTLRTLAIRNKLLAFNTAEPLAAIFRVVLVIWTLLPSNDLRDAKVANAVAPKLMMLLGQTSLIYWTGHEDFYLWCLLIGYTSAKPSSAQPFWFTEQIRMLLEKQLVHVPVENGFLEGLIAFQRRFLFIERVQRHITQQLADYLTDGRLSTAEHPRV